MLLLLVMHAKVKFRITLLDALLIVATWVLHLSLGLKTTGMSDMKSVRGIALYSGTDPS